VLLLLVELLLLLLLLGRPLLFLGRFLGLLSLGTLLQAGKTNSPVSQLWECPETNAAAPTPARPKVKQ
jgi:hypothetical protein